MAEQPRTYERFPLIRRIEHVVMLTSFTTLGVTGLPQKFPLSAVSQFIVSVLGGIENTRNIHHVAAVVMMIGTVYHLVMMGYGLYVRRVRMSMLPSLQDAKDAFQALMYNIGLAKSRPQMGRYTFEEKAEYWAFVWGTIVMAISGFMMWNPIATTRFLPGEFIPAAKAAHGGEAVLAVLAIILWHFYGVHLKFFNKSMWTGKLTEEEMLHEHPLELADIKAGIAHPHVDEAVLKKRRMIYYPIAAVLSLGMLFGIYQFVTLETTAIETIPFVDTGGPVYSPQTPTPAPTSEPAPAAADASFASVNALLGQKCGSCHGTTAMADLNLTTYADMLKGGKSGPAIVPGDAQASKLVAVQSAGGHPSQLTPEELDMIINWINSGAPEE